MKRLEPRLQRELDACGKSWSVEESSKHLRVIVDGYQVAVISKGTNSGGRDGLSNVVACVRRAARGVVYGRTHK